MEQMNLLRENIAKSVNAAFYSGGKRKPHNRLWVALIAFNLIFLPLDIATGVTVGYITHWYYGFFVFGAGFGTMVLHEALYSNPYASNWQKGISIFGFLSSIAVTVIIGLAAIAVSMLSSGYDRDLYGTIMTGIAFSALFLHGILFAAYYFTDHAIVTKQKATAAEAKHEQIMGDFDRAEKQADLMKRLEERLVVRIQNGDSLRMGSALQQLTGENWIDEVEKVATKNPTRGQELTK